MSTPSRLPLHSLALDSPTPNTNIKVTGRTGTKTPSSTGRGNLQSSQSHSKRKRENELFHTKRINTKSSSTETTMNSNASISLKSRIRTIKKIGAIARAWIDSGNELVGLHMNLMGEFICCQRDKLILFSGLQTSTVTPVEVNGDNLDDFDMIGTIATIAMDDNTSRKYLTAVDRDGKVTISTMITLCFNC